MSEPFPGSSSWGDRVDPARALLWKPGVLALGTLRQTSPLILAFLLETEQWGARSGLQVLAVLSSSVPLGTADLGQEACFSVDAEKVCSRLRLVNVSGEVGSTGSET